MFHNKRYYGSMDLLLQLLLELLLELLLVLLLLLLLLHVPYHVRLIRGARSAPPRLPHTHNRAFTHGHRSS